ncbi:hypothetical protein CFC21_111083 [Triticum aestivum]|uniref:BTB domain-containing protein n=2 Tax=Triticum aestivum TaxID=4565 RepID=A0A3B6TR43_WHEAT|nr:hypothetical protein CFC21_111083 [Triticum aestivum]
MEKACTNLTDVVRSVRLLKIKGYSLTRDISSDHCFKSRWNVDGYEWEIRIYPRSRESNHVNGRCVALHLIFLSEARMGAVRTTLRCCLVDPRGIFKPSREDRRSLTFRKPQDTSYTVILMEKDEFEASGYVKDDSFTVQCTLDVLKELPDATAPLKELHLPSCNLHLQFAQLLQSETGADVTFLVSGESFAAHKLILAARSPVFMAEFFGNMKEKCSQSVEIEDMEAEVFKALLKFIYTDTVPEFRHQAEVDAEAVYTDSVPEFEQQEEVDAEAATVMAQHLLAAADRYGLDRLKLICARELSGGINIDTAATALALAEQHNCPELKATCADFIIRTSATLDAVLATEGFKHLEESCPLVVIDLLKSARGRKT